MKSWRGGAGAGREGRSPALEGSPWMTTREAEEYLEMSSPDLEELMRTGQVDLSGSTSNPLLLRRSVVTYRRLREQIG